MQQMSRLPFVGILLLQLFQPRYHSLTSIDSRHVIRSLLYGEFLTAPLKVTFILSQLHAHAHLGVPN
jgi:hypothetical protein